MTEYTTNRSVKIVVPKDIDRDSLVVFAKTVIKDMMKMSNTKIVSIVPSHSKSETEDELTYKVSFINLMPN